MEPALETIGLCKSHGAQRVLCGVSFRIAAGEIIAIGGANGAGKTTLLRCLAARVKPTRGTIRWLGKPASTAARRTVGLVAHEQGLYPQLTLRENLVFAARMGDIRQPHEQAGVWLDRIGLASWAERLPAAISRGMRQRFAIARALIHQPAIVLLDEPFTSLDAAGRIWLTALLQEWQAHGCAICLSTHEEVTLRRWAQRDWRLEAGRLEPADGEAEEMQVRPAA